MSDEPDFVIEPGPGSTFFRSKPDVETIEAERDLLREACVRFLGQIRLDAAGEEWLASPKDIDALEAAVRQTPSHVRRARSTEQRSSTNTSKP